MNTEKQTIEFNEDEAGKRIDAAIAQRLPEHSRAQVQQWIKDGNIYYPDHGPIRTRDKVHAGLTVIVEAKQETQNSWQPETMAIEIVFEDDDIIIVDKPAGLIVHPGAGAHGGTLINGLLAHEPKLNQLPRCGIVHRIDKDTSGLLAVAKSSLAHQSLTEQLQTRSMSRQYQAIVKGTLIAGSTIDAPIDRHPKHRTKMAIHPTGREAITHYRVLERFHHYTHVSIKLESGRTHQIRVHFDHVHHPLVGDPQYGSNIKPPAAKTDSLKQVIKHFKRQALHACELSLHHPRLQQNMTWTSPLPNDMEKLLLALQHEQHTLETN